MMLQRGIRWMSNLMRFSPSVMLFARMLKKEGRNTCMGKSSLRISTFCKMVWLRKVMPMRMR